MKKQKGISILDILIVILIIAVFAAIFIPHRAKNLEQEFQQKARLKLVILSEAMEQYYKTAGGEIDLDPVTAEEVEDTTVIQEVEITDEALDEIEEAAGDTIRPPQVFTEDYESLKNFLPEAEWIKEKANDMGYNFSDYSEFLPENYTPTSYPVNKDFKIFAEDSSYYVIYDPNGYGTILNGKELWNE